MNMDYYHHVPPPFRGYGVLPPQPQLHPQSQPQHPQLQALPQPQPLVQPCADRGIPTELYRPKPTAEPEPPKKKKRNSNDAVNIECLIEEVRKRPACHYQRAPGSEQEENEQGWQEISQILGVSVDALKRKWQYLRSGFMRTHRTLLISTTDKVRENALKWKYYKHLEFLVSHLDLNKKHFSEAIEVMENNVDDPALPSEESEPDNDSHIMDDDLPMMDNDRTPTKLKRSVLKKLKIKKEPKDRKQKTIKTRKKNISDNVPLISLAKRSNISNPINQLFLMTDGCVSLSRREKKFRKRKYKKIPTSPEEINERILEIILQRDDPDQKFLLSLLPIMKRLTSKGNLQARILMQQAINSMIFPEEENDKKVPNDSDNNYIDVPVFKSTLRNKVAISP